jgi:hypothetical protein
MRRRRARQVALIVLGAGVAVVGLAAAVRLLADSAAEWSGGQAAQLGWTGPVHTIDETAMPPMAIDREDRTRALSVDPGGDASLPWVDVTRVTTHFPTQIHWVMELGAFPPDARTLDPTKTLIAYGLVLDTTGDAVADYVVGINNDAPTAGDYRVWVTDLASGETDEQVGAPYGFPVEFSHPDEQRRAPPPGDERPPTMLLTFLDGGPPGLDMGTTRFYAWASVTTAGDVVAWDYAPDASWLRAPPDLPQ